MLGIFLDRRTRGTATARYVTYQPLSRDSKSGRNYGLDAQRRDLDLFFSTCCPDADGCQEIASFTEVKSGVDDDRPQLAAAIATCRAEKATMVVAKLDRLSRRVSFIAGLMEQAASEGWTFRVASMPQADAFQLHIYAVDHLQQLLKDRKDPWGIPRAMSGMKCQDGDAGGQLLKGQQGIPMEFLGNGRGGEWRHEVSCDCF